jgi:hypothetical protein
MNLGRIGLISRMFPQARYVYIERDGVEVAYSYRENGLYPDLASGAHRWVQSRLTWHSFAKSVPASRRADVRYDELVKDHETVIGHLLSHFGIRPRPHPIDVSTALGDVATRAHHRQVASPTIARNPRDAARSRLTADERRELGAAFGSSLQDAGYEPLPQ